MQCLIYIFIIVLFTPFQETPDYFNKFKIIVFYCIVLYQSFQYQTKYIKYIIIVLKLGIGLWNLIRFLRGSTVGKTRGKYVFVKFCCCRILSERTNTA